MARTSSALRLRRFASAVELPLGRGGEARLAAETAGQALPPIHVIDVMAGDRAGAEGFAIGPGLYALTLEFDWPGQVPRPVLFIDAGERSARILHSAQDRRSAWRFVFETAGPVGGLSCRFHDLEAGPAPVLRRATLRRLSTTLWRAGRVAGVLSSEIRSFGDASRLFRRAVRLLRQEGRGGLLRAAVRISARQASDVVRSYGNWVLSFDTPNPASLAAFRRTCDALPSRPLISVLMPTYETPAELLEAAIASVREQIYPDWELCIADDASKAPHVREIIERHASEDGRIRFIRRERRGNISRASNTALSLATGEWLALLDHDDLLRPHALLEIASCIGAHPDAEIIYSDEDKIDLAGRRFDAFFKPDFSIDTFRSVNFLNHLTVHRTRNVRAADGWREGFEGSQDYDLNLRIIERIPPSSILHIPKILYHWRAVDGSTASDPRAKQGAWQAGRAALQDHLVRTGLAGRVEAIPNLPLYRFRPRLAAPAPLVSLIVPTRDRADLLGRCVDSILTRTSYPRYEIIVVDNGSVDRECLALLGELKGRANVRVLNHAGPFNYSAMNNRAVAAAQGALIGLVNNDVQVISGDWLDEMVSWASQESIGCVGVKLLYTDGTVQHAGVILGLGGVAGHSHKHARREDAGYLGRLGIVQNLSAVTGACLVVRKSVYEAVGGLDETDLPVAFSDVDFCLKVRAAGYRNLWTPFAELVHLESASRGGENGLARKIRFAREVDHMMRRWGPQLAADPFYSPNLSLNHENFSLAFPPRVPQAGMVGDTSQPAAPAAM